MAADAAPFRSVTPLTLRRSSVSGAHVESVIARASGIFGVLFGVQAVPVLIAQASETALVWNVLAVAALFGSLVTGLVAAFLGRWVKQAQALIAIVFLVVLETWPLAVTGSQSDIGGNYWLYYLLTVAAGCAAIGLNPVIATTYVFVTPVLYALIRLTPAGGSATWERATFDSVYSILLGATILVIATMLRHAAASVDTAQATALERYAQVVRQHATEAERVEVDSIVHDSVLTTLLSAARADTAEAKELAATMAANAIAHLQEAALVAPADGSTVRLSTLATRIADAATTIGSDFEVRRRDIGTRAIPVHAAEAVYSAAVQAMVNSVQHAGTGKRISRWLVVRGMSPTGIEVEIGDSGVGFSIVTVPRGRLGLRVSIVERVAGVGGTATIESRPGEGTVVSIRWPDGVETAAS